MIQWMLAIWFLVPLTFLNSVWTSGCSWFMYCWSLAWRILIITLLACGISAIVHWFDCSLALSFFGIEMKTDVFQSCGYFWVFQICWYIECTTLTTSSFRIISSGQFSCIWLFETPWTAAHQASLSITNSQSLCTHIHWVGDAIQPSHPLSSPSPPTFNLSQHQGLFKWVSSLH